ncbi:MAG TPA: hypothetical protein P5532_19530 [Planctomycetota bacterium]|nr:hypothetical protein [Planctomycetota bacterium]
MTVCVKDATPRKVLQEIQVGWSAVGPLLTLRHGSFVCIVEKDLYEDRSWPLNAKRVPGFEVKGMQYDQVCGMAIDAVQNAWRSEVGANARWKYTVMAHPSFYPVSLPWREPVTATIREGSARDVLCQVAMLQPNCFWGAEAFLDADGKSTSWSLEFGSWSDRSGRTCDELVGMLLRGPAAGNAEQYCVSMDIMTILRSRGVEGTRALIHAFGEVSDNTDRILLLGWMRQQCVWLDSAEALLTFAREERDKRRDSMPRDRKERGMTGTVDDYLDRLESQALQVVRADSAGHPAGYSAVVIIATAVATTGLAIVVSMLRRRRRRKQRKNGDAGL